MVLLFACPSLGQEVDRFIVFFKDKANSQYSVDRPEEFLSDRAINRRKNQSIEISKQDLPVSAIYLDSLRNNGFEPIFSSRWMNAVLIEADPADMVPLVHTSFVKDYKYVAPNHKLNVKTAETGNLFEPKDPTDIRITSTRQNEMLGADQMHMEGMTGQGVLIAVFDGGFVKVNRSSVFGHLFREGRILDKHDFMTNSQNVFAHDDHGTSALSCIAAKYEDSMVGTAYDASFALYVTEDVRSEFRIEEYNWLFAAERADSLGADIISSSLGYSEFHDENMNYDYEKDADGKSSIVSQAAQWASDRGILVVNSAGNEGINRQWPHIVFPSDVEDVLAVGAVDFDGNYTSFSSSGPTADGRIKPDVVALGRNVATFNDRNSISPVNGTSFSAPLISGFAAALWGKYPDLTNKELKELIIRSCSNLNSPDTLVGYGVPDYIKATQQVSLSIQEVFDGYVSVFPNPLTDRRLTVKIDDQLANESIELLVIAPDGSDAGKKSIRKHKKGHDHHIHIESNAKGVYVLKIAVGDRVKFVKLLRY